MLHPSPQMKLWAHTARHPAHLSRSVGLFCACFTRQRAGNASEGALEYASPFHLWPKLPDNFSCHWATRTLELALGLSSFLSPKNSAKKWGHYQQLHRTLESFRGLSMSHLPQECPSFVPVHNKSQDQVSDFNCQVLFSLSFQCLSMFSPTF